MRKERKRVREKRGAEIHTQAERERTSERALFTNTRILGGERERGRDRGSQREGALVIHTRF